MTVQLGRFQLPSSRPWVMGIVNLTPDSFFDGGLVCSVDQARTQAAKLKAQGAHILDLGGESTRPGARPVAPEEEARRVLPVLEAYSEGWLCGLYYAYARRATDHAAGAQLQRCS